MFLENDLDILIHMITAPDISHVNEVEGVMPLANLVLQNQAYSREKMCDKFETLFKSIGNSTKRIRDTIALDKEKNKNNNCLEAWRKASSKSLFET